MAFVSNIFVEGVVERHLEIVGSESKSLVMSVVGMIGIPGANPGEVE